MSTVWEALARALSPVEDRPRVVPELESAAYTTRSGAEYVVVHNVRAQSYARLDPREFELLALMDGHHSVKELVVAYYQRYGVLALARVAGLVRLLRLQRLLVEGSLDAYADLASRLRGRSPPATTQLTTSAVDTWLAVAYRTWGYAFFSRPWLLIGLALGAIGPALVAFELVRGRYALPDVGGSSVLTVVLLVILAVFALAVHELGHGLAVKHAGRRVYQAGVRLYFGLPAAFVDTSDIWMAPPRQRLLTAFAGPWTGLVLGGLFALGAAILGGGAPGTFLFTAAFVFLVDNVFNFNPLLELDGYYMLVDFLDRPFLRARALAFVRGPLWARLAHREKLSAEERLLAGFGIGAIVYAAVAVALAVRAWEALLLPFIADNLASGERLREFVGLVTLGVIGSAVLMAAFVLLRRVMGPLRSWAGQLGGRAVELRHREALAALRAVPLWSELPSGRVLEVARAMRAEDVPAGAEVVRQGDLGGRFYLIGHGAFEVLVDGRPQVRLGRGDFFGERALLQAVPRAATVVATQPGRVFALERAQFDSLLASDLAARARVEAALAYRDEVAAMPLFGGLSPGELDVLLSRFTPVSVGEGQVVIWQGEAAERFYVVRSGQLVVERDRRELARLGPGEAFGEIALLLEVPRTATVSALTDSSLLALEAQDFRDLLAGYLGRAGELERLSHLRLLSHKRLDEIV